MPWMYWVVTKYESNIKLLTSINEIVRFFLLQITAAYQSKPHPLYLSSSDAAKTTTTPTKF